MAAIASELTVPIRPATGTIKAGLGQLKRDYDFIKEPPDSLNCLICCELPQEPHLLGCCGHHLCKACVDRIHRDKKPCPLCQGENFTSMLDKGRQRDVHALRIRCLNRNEGCEWEGELGKLGEHLHPVKGDKDYSVEQNRGCRFQLVECRSGCGEKFERQVLHNHESHECPHRPSNCEYCGNYGAMHVQVQEHWKECECYPVACPYSCDTGKVERKNLGEHIQSYCPLVVVKCVYGTAGCLFERPRKDMQAHLDTQQHYHNTLLLRKNLELQKCLEMKDEQVTAVVEQTRIMAEQLQKVVNDVQHLRGRLEDRGAQVNALTAERTALREEIDRTNGRLDHEREVLRNEGREMEEETGKRLAALHEEITVLKQKQTEQKAFITETEVVKNALSTEMKGLWETLKQQQERHQHEFEEVKQRLQEDGEKLGREIAAASEANRDEIQAVGRKCMNTEHEVAQLKQKQEVENQRSMEAIARVEQLIPQIQEAYQTNQRDSAQIQEGFRVHLGRLETQQVQQNLEVNGVTDSVEHQRQQIEAGRADLQETEQGLRTQSQALRQDIEQLKQTQQGQQLQLREVQQLRESIVYVERCVTPTPPFHFTVNRYSQRKKNSEPFVSGPFYSHIRGYKFCVRVSIGPTDIVAVYGCLQRGEHDFRLHWPFRGRIYVRLRNQKADHNHIDRVITYDTETPETHAGRVEMGDKSYLKVWDRSVSVLNVPADRQYIAGEALDFVVTRIEVDIDV